MQGKPPDFRKWAWGASLTIIAGICIAWSSLPSLDASPTLRVALFAAMGFAMLGTVFLFPNSPDSKTLILIPAILLRLILWPAPVSDDVNRYLWEGQLVAAGENPYTAPADDPRWESRRDATWQAMNHRDRPTAYPPGIQWVMAATASISPSLKSFKALALLGDLATLLLLFALLRENAAPLRWAGFYAFNPVILISFAAEAHFDSLMVAALLAAILAASRERKSAWLWLGLAIQIKLVCLILIPLFLIQRKKPRMHPKGIADANLREWISSHRIQKIRENSRPFAVKIFLFVAVLILPTLPFLTALPQWIDGVRTFASGGAFNAPLFTLLASTGLALGLVKNLCLTAFAISATATVIFRWKGMPLTDSILWMLGALLVCSPIVHFWYLAWLLPLTAIRPSFAWTTASITIAGYFLAWQTQQTHGWWGFGHGIAAIIWIPWLLAGVAQHRFLLKKWLGSPAPGRSPGILPGDTVFAIIIPTLKPSPSLTTLIQTLRSEISPETEIILATCERAIPRGPHAPRVLFPAPSPGTRPEPTDCLNPYLDADQTLNPTAGQRGRSPEHAAARVLPDGFTADLPNSFNFTITAPRGRGNQIAAAIATTTAPWILIVHADTTPPPGFAKHLQEAATKHPDASLIVCGQRFDRPGLGTLLIEALNELRVVFGGVAFGDQTMFIRRSALEASGGFPAQPLMEDVEASLRLATKGRILYLGQEWNVSAKKWSGNFPKRFALVIRLVATYQLARLRSPAYAAAVSERMYRDYYPSAPPKG